MQTVGISWFDVLFAFHEHRKTSGASLSDLYSDFRDDSVNGIWETRGDLEYSVKSEMSKYLADDEGTNEMAKGKAKAVFRTLKEIHDLLFLQMETQLKKAGLMDQDMKLYLKELKVYSELRKTALLDASVTYTNTFIYDFQAMNEESFFVDPHEYKTKNPVSLVFKHNEHQINLLDSYVTQYGSSLDGLGRILMRTQFYDLMRIADPVDSRQLLSSQAN
jgi:hypothetical protein